MSHGNMYLLLLCLGLKVIFWQNASGQVDEITTCLTSSLLILQSISSAQYTKLVHGKNLATNLWKVHKSHITFLKLYA